MKLKTPSGIYKYKFTPFYAGKKKMNKEIATENLLLFKEIADKNNLKFGLCYGTLLGAVREHDFIDHDEDTDLFIMNEQKDLFLNMLFEFRKHGFEVGRCDRRGSLISILRKGEYIDVYIYHPLGNGIYQTVDVPVPERFLFDLSLYEFKGEKFLGASDSEELMLFFYGRDWNIPVSEPQITRFRHWQLYTKAYVFQYMPGFLFNIVAKRIRIRKMDTFKKQIDRLNQYLIENNKAESVHKI